MTIAENFSNPDKLRHRIFNDGFSFIAEYARSWRFKVGDNDEVYIAKKACCLVDDKGKIYCGKFTKYDNHPNNNFVAVMIHRWFFSKVRNEGTASDKKALAEIERMEGLF